MYASIDFNYLLMARGCTTKDLRHCANGLFRKHKKKSSSSCVCKCWTINSIKFQRDSN